MKVLNFDTFGEKMLKVLINLNQAAKMPTKAYPGDAGFDLYAMTKSEKGIVQEYDTGVSIAIPSGYVGLLFSRSSIINKDLTLKNCVGVIDSGYRGSIKVVFTKSGEKDYSVGDKVAQLVIVPIPAVDLVVGELPPSLRSNQSFGSSGD
jgi:dUTP pyrophosphatase